ncbi:MAG: CobD/CbiB family protein [Betaproteobacteria bacterium]|nr:CobD/CbiB family protein [Betaproteobacteria bacterium]
MTFIALLAAFLLEQARPHPYPNLAVRGFILFAGRAARYLNAGRPSHGALSWCASVLPPVLTASVLSWGLAAANPFLGWIWFVAVLFFTTGFRQVSHFFTGIARALKAGDGQRAKDLISQWRNESRFEIEDGDVAKLTIEEGLRGAHRFVFGPVLFAVFFGPAGAVLYRLAAILREEWAGQEPELAQLGRFAGTAFKWLDWVPSRITAAGFAVAGNFEDAFYCWRTQAGAWPDPFNAPLLASGAGALGVKLGGPLRRLASVEERPGLGMGDEPDIDALDSTVGLIWRATVIWMIVLLMVTIARWVG